MTVQNREYVLHQPTRDEEFAIRRRDWETIRANLQVSVPEMPWTAPAGWAGIGAGASGGFTFIGLLASGGLAWVLALTGSLSAAALGVGALLLYITREHKKTANSRVQGVAKLMDDITRECAPSSETERRGSEVSAPPSPEAYEGAATAPGAA